MTGCFLTDRERGAIQTVIDYRADQLRQPRFEIQRSLFRHLGVQNLREFIPLDCVAVIGHLLALGGGSNAQ